MVDYPSSVFGIHRILRARRDLSGAVPLGVDVDSQASVQRSRFGGSCHASKVHLVVQILSVRLMFFQVTVQNPRP